MRKTVAGWGVFATGICLLLWMHTFRDQIAHAVILPTFLAIWVALVLAVWRGRRAVTGGRCKMILAFALQMILAVCISLWFFQRIINAS